MNVAEKKASLEAQLRGLGSVLVAYSGGVDSAYLAATAHSVLGGSMLAVIADSASLARRDFDDAVSFAQKQGFPLRVVKTAELEHEEYVRNDGQRCFHCKDELFRTMEAVRDEIGFQHLAFGMNADDVGDYRPGQRAAAEHGVVAPLKDAGLTKADIRQLAQSAGYPLWDRPASPCLSSRVEYGRAVTAEVLHQIERAEAGLRTLGYREFRVRHHGDLARVEIARDELAQALSLDAMRAISRVAREAGYRYVTLDCEGFQSGSLNAVLSAEMLRRRGV